MASGYTPALGDKFFLIGETSAALLVLGGFANTPVIEAIFDSGGVLFQINYQDSDLNDPSGTSLNDVSVTVAPEPSTWKATLGGLVLVASLVCRRRGSRA